jgi:hypothetical protein
MVTVTGEGKPINPSSRQLFDPTLTPRLKTSEPTFEELAAALDHEGKSSILAYASPSFFHITPNYRPQDDVNLECEEEVSTSTHLPLSLIEKVANMSSPNEELPPYSPEQVDAVEKCTRGQAENPEWKRYRQGLITASSMHEVKTKVETLSNATSKRSKGTDKLVEKLCLGKGPDPDLFNLKYGREMEETARGEYIQRMKQDGHRHIKVEKSGLVLSKEHAFIGASPDGVVSCDCCGEGLLEVKCVVPRKRKSGVNILDTIDYLVTSNEQHTLKHSHRYYTQLQTQMAVTGHAWVDFFVLLPKNVGQRHHVERVYRDDVTCNLLMVNAQYFFIKCMLPYLYSRSYETAEPSGSGGAGVGEWVWVGGSAGVGEWEDGRAGVGEWEDGRAGVGEWELEGGIAGVGEQNDIHDLTEIMCEVVIQDDIKNDVITLLPTEKTMGSSDAKLEKRRRRQRRKRQGNVMPLHICDMCTKDCHYTDYLKEETGNSVQCGRCLHWYHWGCVNFTQEREDEDFFCAKCISLV